MKFSKLKEKMKEMKEGHRFEVFEGSGIFATVVLKNTRENNAKLGHTFLTFMEEKGIEDFNDLTEEQNLEASSLHIVKNVIVNIEGLEDDDGNEIEWSEELGIEILKDPEFSELVSRILEKSTSEKVFFSDSTKKN